MAGGGLFAQAFMRYFVLETAFIAVCFSWMFMIRTYDTFYAASPSLVGCRECADGRVNWALPPSEVT